MDTTVRKEDLWETRILSAIGKVRLQKQRPNMERVAAVLRQTHEVSPDEVLSNLEAQVKAGNVLYIETGGVGCYADPKYPPTRTGKMIGRKSTAQSKTGDLVGKVVMAVKDIVSRKKEEQKKKKDSVVAAHLSSISPLIGVNGGSERNIMATMKDIVGQVNKTVPEDEQIEPAQLRKAVKRAVIRGFLKETGKYYTIDDSKEFNIKGRKRRNIHDQVVPHEMSHLLIEDDGSSDSSLSDSSIFISDSMSAISSPLLNVSICGNLAHSTDDKAEDRVSLRSESPHKKSPFNTKFSSSKSKKAKSSAKEKAWCILCREEVPQDMVWCKGCNGSAHPSCAGSSVNWRCLECALCGVCGHPSTQGSGSLLQCGECRERAHLSCTALQRVPHHYVCSSCSTSNRQHYTSPFPPKGSPQKSNPVSPAFGNSPTKDGNGRQGHVKKTTPTKSTVSSPNHPLRSPSKKAPSHNTLNPSIDESPKATNVRQQSTSPQRTKYQSEDDADTVNTPSELEQTPVTDKKCIDKQQGNKQSQVDRKNRASLGPSKKKLKLDQSSSKSSGSGCGAASASGQVVVKTELELLDNKSTREHGVTNHKAATGRTNQKAIVVGHKQANAVAIEHSPFANLKQQTSAVSDKLLNPTVNCKHGSQAAKEKLKALMADKRSTEKQSKDKVSEERIKFSRHCDKVDGKSVSASKVKGQSPKVLPKKRVYEELDTVEEDTCPSQETLSSHKEVKGTGPAGKDDSCVEQTSKQRAASSNLKNASNDIPGTSFVPVEDSMPAGNGSGSSSGSGSPMEEASSTTSSGGMVTSGHLRSLFDGLSHLYLTSATDPRGCKRLSAVGNKDLPQEQETASMSHVVGSTYFSSASQYQQVLSEDAVPISAEVKSALTAEFIASTSSQNHEKIMKMKESAAKQFVTKGDDTKSLSPVLLQKIEDDGKSAVIDDNDTSVKRVESSVSREAKHQCNTPHHHHCRRHHHKHHKHRHHHHRRRKGKHVCCTLC